MLLTPAASSAQPAGAEPLDKQLKGVWLVEAADVVRALNITRVAATPDGGAALEATYAGSAAKVVLLSPAPLQLEVTTAAGTLLALGAAAPGRLVGSFASRTASGAVSAGRFSSQQSAEAAGKCGVGEAVWEGQWSQGNFGVVTLWLGEVAGDCSATVRYGRVKETVTVEGGAFQFKCNPGTAGHCSFKARGADLWASYSNPMGGSNNAVFRPVVAR